MDDPLPRFALILKTLVEHRVQFIVVGNVSARLHGAPVLTDDLDLVHARAPENVSRLLEALKALSAYYRDRRLKPRAAFLETDGHNLLMTTAGPLDLLGTLKNDRGYLELLPHTEELKLKGLKIRVLDLPTLIRIKEETGRPKDKAVLPLLRSILAERAATRRPRRRGKK